MSEKKHFLAGQIQIDFLKSLIALISTEIVISTVDYVAGFIVYFISRG